MKNFALFLIALASTFVQARTLDDVRKSKELLAGLDAASPPYNYYQGSQLAGIEVELIEQIAKKEGWKVTYKVAPFNTLIVGLKQGKFDLVVSGHTITPEREKQVDFLTPIYCTDGVLVSKKGGPKTAAEMKGKAVAVPVGTDYYAHALQIPGIGEVKTLPSETDALGAVLAGRADAWISDDSIAERAVKAHPELQLGAALFSTHVAWMAAPQNKALRDAVDSDIKNALSDGSYLASLKKHVGKDIRCK